MISLLNLVFGNMVARTAVHVWNSFIQGEVVHSTVLETGEQTIHASFPALQIGVVMIDIYRGSTEAA